MSARKQRPQAVPPEPQGLVAHGTSISGNGRAPAPVTLGNFASGLISIKVDYPLAFYRQATLSGMWGNPWM
jgi:hypothetical protein